MNDDVFGDGQRVRPPSGLNVMITIGMGLACLGVVMLLFNELLPFAVLTIVFGVAFIVVAGSEYRRSS